MKRTFVIVAALCLSSLPALATDPCAHYVSVGSFSSRANAIARTKQVPGASLTFGNSVVPTFTPGMWHAYVGPLQTFIAADRTASKLRSRIPDAYPKHDCTGVED